MANYQTVRAQLEKEKEKKLFVQKPLYHCPPPAAATIALSPQDIWKLIESFTIFPYKL